MSDRAENAGAQVEVDDLHKVRAILRTSDYSVPKRNSKLHCEMWTNPFLPSAFWRAVPCALRFTRLRRATRPFPVMGLYHDWKRGGTKRISLPAMIAVFEELNHLHL